MAKFSLEDLARLRDLVMAGKLHPALDRTYPLVQGREAVRYVGTGRARAKVVITAGPAQSDVLAEAEDPRRRQ